MIAIRGRFVDMVRLGTFQKSKQVSVLHYVNKNFFKTRYGNIVDSGEWGFGYKSFDDNILLPRKRPIYCRQIFIGHRRLIDTHQKILYSGLTVFLNLYDGNAPIREVLSQILQNVRPPDTKLDIRKIFPNSVEKRGQGIRNRQTKLPFVLPGVDPSPETLQRSTLYHLIQPPPHRRSWNVAVTGTGQL
ncbi:MAG: hypothetical protein PF508_08790 [Spirochaeta sp.]|nr:hypothetical protein [Spirochaeta sp.]